MSIGGRGLRSVRAFIALVGLFTPWRRVVVFLHLAEAELAEFDVARGPLIGASAVDEPLASRWDQLDGVGPRQLEVLHNLLDANGRSPWAHVCRSGRAALYSVRDEFRDALSALRARSAELDAAEPAANGRRTRDARAERILAPYTAVAERWLKSSVWASGMTVDGVESILIQAAGHAASASEADEPLYFWYGPAVPLAAFRVTRDTNGKRRWTRE